jgi:iron complex transport system permease protein
LEPEAAILKKANRHGVGNLLDRPYLLNTVLLVFALLLSVAIGAVFVPPGIIVRMLLAEIPGVTILPDWPETFSTIVLRIRLPHTVLIALTGAALAGSGSAYQGIFRNPLADPYLIGVASGAGLGAVTAMALRFPSDLLGMYTIPAAAFAGAVLTVVIVHALARSSGGIPATTLILAGVAVGSFASALTSFLMLHTEGDLIRAMAWMLGGSTMGGWEPVIAAFPYIAAGLGLLLTAGHSLNVMQFGDEQAQQLGIRVDWTRTLLISAASLATAAAVSFSGVIGFIGLIVPHLIRIIWGPDYRRLVPLSILGGASLLLLADLLSRVLLAPQELPVGVVTSLTGAPFFLWVLRQSQRNRN